MTTSTIEYLGELRTRITHTRSGQQFITDAPPDNQGKGEAISPTDLLATSLGACAVTIIGIAANTHGFCIDGTKINITKIMAANPRRVSEVIVEFYFPKNDYTEKQKTIIRQSALTCPVFQSLHPDLKKNLEFHF
ncbi:MAG: OsmC family protein [Bacteroidales bacterium]|nr:OsmC family protein [Bacteroidales bacterium]